MECLEITGLTQKFGGLTAVDDFSLSMSKGMIYGLIGPNGSGKSTVFNCISRFYRPQAGRVLFEGKDLLKLKPHHIIRQGISRTFQNLQLFQNMSVMENLLVGHHVHFRSTIFRCAFPLSGVLKEEQAALQRIHEVLDFLELGRHLHTITAHLPFGIQRLVELSRALVSHPRLLLLDEPASGMNPHETRGIISTLERIRSHFNLSILLVEHNMTIVMALCERIAVMNFGRKITEGTPDEIRSHNGVIEAYLGEKVEDARSS